MTRYLYPTVYAIGVAVALALAMAGCGLGEIDEGQSITELPEGLTGCRGHASSSIPSSGSYFLTSFGNGSDSGIMSCGTNTNHGSWYYAASRQRYGCGSHIQIEANGKCVVAKTDDYGPDVCVENAAGGPIIDASPLVSEHLFGVSSAGWSDRLRVHVTEVPTSTPLGPCSGGGSPPPPSPPPPPPQPSGSCHSSTLSAYVPAATCVQSASDQSWYTCQGGAWVAGQHSCAISYAWCYSSTLSAYEPPRTCVQSARDSVWYQCTADGWSSPVAGGAGPLGTCSSSHPL
ncbi:MAG TPA: hypothetical protein VKN99_03895 [Polyangia bacterium]|nr:hypothetical protein [Polyangia bacterium]